MLNKKIAKALLQIKAVSVVDKDHLYTWASGIKSPIYCDNRMTMSFPEVRALIADGFAETVREQFSNVDVIAGTATAGIPHAAWLAERLNLPMVYVRSSAKGHGKGNQIEGASVAGKRVVLIEDLISTGGSSLQAVEALRAAGADVLVVAAIFSYNFDEASERFAAANMPFLSLTDYQTLLPVAVEQGYIDEGDREELAKWRHNPRIFTV